MVQCNSHGLFLSTALYDFAIYVVSKQFQIPFPRSTTFCSYSVFRVCATELLLVVCDCTTPKEHCSMLSQVSEKIAIVAVPKREAQLNDYAHLNCHLITIEDDEKIATAERQNKGLCTSDSHQFVYNRACPWKIALATHLISITIKHHPN